MDRAIYNRDTVREANKPKRYIFRPYVLLGNIKTFLRYTFSAIMVALVLWIAVSWVDVIMCSKAPHDENHRLATWNALGISLSEYSDRWDSHR